MLRDDESKISIYQNDFAACYDPVADNEVYRIAHVPIKFDDITGT